MRGFFFSSRRRHTRWTGDWSSDVCSSDLRRITRVTRDPRETCFLLQRISVAIQKNAASVLGTLPHLVDEKYVWGPSPPPPCVPHPPFLPFSSSSFLDMIIIIHVI